MEKERAGRKENRIRQNESGEKEECKREREREREVIRGRRGERMSMDRRK